MGLPYSRKEWYNYKKADGRVGIMELTTRILMESEPEQGTMIRLVFPQEKR